MRKNFLVMAMVVAMMIPGFQLRVEAEEGVISEDNVYTESIHFVEKIIEEATSWEEVMRKMSPMLGSYSNFESHEDFCYALVLDGVDRIVTDPMYPDVSLSFKVELKDSDFEELNEKFLKIAELYNASNQLPIELEAKKISNEEFEVNIGFDVTKPVVTIGQNAIVRADRKFWEKPSMTGSYGNTSNLEIKMVTVNGVAYVDEKGNVLESYYKPYNQISDKELVIDDRPHMLHICTENTDLGWISEYDVVGIDY